MLIFHILECGKSKTTNEDSLLCKSKVLSGPFLFEIIFFVTFPLKAINNQIIPFSPSIPNYMSKCLLFTKIRDTKASLPQ